MRSDKPLEIVPLGTGGFFAASRYHTCLCILAGGTTILIDCPEPLIRMCTEASHKSGQQITPEKIDHIVLTHLHGDHCNGLEGFGFLRKFMRKDGDRPCIHTTRWVADRLWQKLSVSMAKTYSATDEVIEEYSLEDYFDVQAFDFGDSFDVCGVEFQTRRTLHSLPCFGFTAAFGGRKFGYSCDTSFDPGHIDFLKESHLIFHECGKGMHSARQSLEALPQELRNKMRLIHLDDDFVPNTQLEIAEEGRLYLV